MIALKLFYIAQLPDWSVDGDTTEKGLCNFKGEWFRYQKLHFNILSYLLGIRRTFVHLHGVVEVRTFKVSGLVM